MHLIGYAFDILFGLQKTAIRKVGNRLPLLFASCLMLLVVPGTTKAQDAVTRKNLLKAPGGGVTLNMIDAREVRLPAGGKAPYHKHPCPVAGYVVSGTLLFQVEGKASQKIKRGAAFFEPAHAPIVHFDNASSDQPLVFIAFYLIDSTQELIQELPLSGVNVTPEKKGSKSH